MGQPHQFGPSSDLQRIIRTLECELQSLRRLVDKTDLRLDSIERCLRQLKAVGLPLSASQHQLDFLPAAPKTAHRPPVMAVPPNHKGVNSIAIRPQASGAAAVQIDAGTEFLLPQALSSLLEVLMLDNRHSDDEFVGWKSLKEIASQLAKRGEVKVTRRALVQRVYRLRRDLFVRGGVSPHLVQTNRRRGARVALKRRPPYVTGGEEV
jgi:hypothetical protein